MLAVLLVIGSIALASSNAEAARQPTTFPVTTVKYFEDWDALVVPALDAAGSYQVSSVPVPSTVTPTGLYGGPIAPGLMLQVAATGPTGRVSAIIITDFGTNPAAYFMVVEAAMTNAFPDGASKRSITRAYGPLGEMALIAADSVKPRHLGKVDFYTKGFHPARAYMAVPRGRPLPTAAYAAATGSATR